MIEHLKGMHETVNFKENTNLRLYDNTKVENYPEHWHTPMEIIMPLVGNYTVVLGHTIKELEPFDIILICPGTIHALQAPPSGRRIIFQAEVNVLRQFKEFESVLTLISPAITITSKSTPEIHSVFKKKLLNILDEYTNDCTLSEMAIYSYLLQLFVSLGRNYTVNLDCFDVGNQKPKEYTEKFIQICYYINEHYTEDLALDALAHIAGFSKYHFARLFKQFTGVTFYKYLTKKRISHAEQLLIDPEIAITEIATRCGFSNLSAFTRMFKLLKCCTPTEYRNMYSKC